MHVRRIASAGLLAVQVWARESVHMGGPLKGRKLLKRDVLVGVFDCYGGRVRGGDMDQ